jgi:hypothetical protein
MSGSSEISLKCSSKDAFVSFLSKASSEVTTILRQTEEQAMNVFETYREDKNRTMETTRINLLKLIQTPVTDVTTKSEWATYMTRLYVLLQVAVPRKWNVYGRKVTLRVDVCGHKFNPAAEEYDKLFLCLGSDFLMGVAWFSNYAKDQEFDEFKRLLNKKLTYWQEFVRLTDQPVFLSRKKKDKKPQTSFHRGLSSVMMFMDTNTVKAEAARLLEAMWKRRRQWAFYDAYDETARDQVRVKYKEVRTRDRILLSYLSKFIEECDPLLMRVKFMDSFEYATWARLPQTMRVDMYEFAKQVMKTGVAFSTRQKHKEQEKSVLDKFFRRIEEERSTLPSEKKRKSVERYPSPQKRSRGVRL